ncbi:MAG: IS1595 family transposase [Candidatus Korobacteraceae bacterium]|jgi:transposase-like protein
MKADKSPEPKTLQEAIQYFTGPDNCLAYMIPLTFPDGIVTCPTCGRTDPKFLANQRRWQCKSVHPKRQFSAKVGTIFEDSPIPLEKWLPAVWMIVNDKNGISSWELHRALGVTQKTAWFMLHRIRLAMQEKSSFKLGGNGGPVEVDETFIGGKARNMHKSRKERMSRKAGPGGLYAGGAKAIVMGMLQRGGKVKAQVIPERKRLPMHGIIQDSIEKGAIVMTDEHTVYMGLSDEYVHEIINHAEAYVKDHISINGIENFWSLLKRGIGGTYVSVEPFHLFRYIDEQAFRYNNRATKDNPLNDSDRFALALSQIVGKRLTYSELTGKEGQSAF